MHLMPPSHIVTSFGEFNSPYAQLTNKENVRLRPAPQSYISSRYHIETYSVRLKVMGRLKEANGPEPNPSNEQDRHPHPT